MTRQKLEEMLANGSATIANAPKKNKYNATRVAIDGINFASKAEGDFYIQLKILQAAKKISHFFMQVPIHLPGGIKYVLDFLVVGMNGELTYFDRKGFRTPIFILKKKQVEALYPIKITEV